MRHGRTSANAAGLLQGRIDLPLDEVGVAQATAVVSIVPTPDILIVSPALRARQTAEAFGSRPTIDERWHELDFGSLDGTPVAEVPADLWAQWRTDPSFAPARGEPLVELDRRVRAACDELLEAARDAEVVVVTHATPIKAAMAWALGATVTTTWRSFVDQASVTRIAVREHGPVLVGFNERPTVGG